MQIPVFQGPSQPRPRHTRLSQAGNGAVQARAGLDYLRKLRA